MSKKHKKVYRVLNYIENLLILVSTVTGCLYVSAFASLVGNSIEITRSAIGLKTCVITAGIKKYKSITKTKKRSMIKQYHQQNLNLTAQKFLTDLNISHDEFVTINNVRKEFYDMMGEIEKSNDNEKLKLYVKQCYLIV